MTKILHSSRTVANSLENVSDTESTIEREVRELSKTIRQGSYNRKKLLNRICETSFSNESFESFVYQLLGLSNAEEKLKSVRKREASYLEDGSWPYIALSGHHVLAAISELNLGKEDVFTEVGCGLGINSILVGLTTEIGVEGFDINPDWVKLANEIASDMGRDDIDFYVQDACFANYEDTNIFLIYSPFEDPSLIVKMLKRIEPCAEQRPITIMAAYEDLVNVLDEVSWVKPAGNIGPIEFFKSV